MSKLYVDELEPKTSSNKKITSSKHIGGKAVHCWIHPTSSQSVPNGGTTFITMHEAFADTHNMADVANDAIVIGEGLEGYYNIQGAVRNSSWTAPRHSIQIFVNGSIKAFHEYSSGSSHTGEYPHSVISTMLYLEASDVVKLKLYHNYGSDRTTYSVGAGDDESHLQSYLWLYRIGD